MRDGLPDGGRASAARVPAIGSGQTRTWTSYGDLAAFLGSGAGRGGTAEVVFQYLAAREPLTDRALRAELLTRLNTLDGVDLPEGKLELRPNIRLSLLEKDRNRELLTETLTRFRDRWESRGTS
ncbi:hypothetical protein ACWZEH_31885 [Streptomyces sp. QTS137]